MSNDKTLSFSQQTHHAFVDHLSARLPELMWKLNTLKGVFNPLLLPRGLFRPAIEMTPQACIDEIRANLEALKQPQSARIAHYLAERVNRQINVLVRLCQLDAPKAAPQESRGLNIQTISTRQQWLQALEVEIANLSEQQQALQRAYQLQLANQKNASVLLTLQADIGEMERRLSLAKETLAREMH